MQILQDLKGAGLVTSIRGAAGGYLLSRLPEELSLAELLDVVEGPHDSTCCAPANRPSRRCSPKSVTTWQPSRRERLEAITLADLLDRAAIGSGEMWYI